MSVLRKKDKGGGMMERLTREMTFEEEYIILQKEVKELFDKEDRESEPPESHCVVRRALRCIKKLVSEVEQYKAYNDLEEQGRLIKLPCKVGDTIYGLHKAMVCELNTETIGISKMPSGEILYLIDGWELDKGDFGKTLFLTKSEAEQKLKEMESD